MNRIKSFKKIYFLFYIFFLGSHFLSAQTNLDLANQYYDSDDYLNAVDFYWKTIFEDKQYNGTIFYRYAYSMEKNDFTKNKYTDYYCAAAYCFENAGETDNKYYSYAIAKEEQLEISHDNFSNNTIKKLLRQDLISKVVDFFDKHILQSDFIMTKETLIILGIIILLIYIIGCIFSDRTECVILSSFKELILLSIPYILMIVVIFEPTIDRDNWMFIFLISLATSFISTIIFSIYENLGTKKPVLYIFISLITKLAIFIIAPITLLLSTFAMTKSEKDRRYKDGTKNNQRTKNIGIALAVLSGIVFSLMKAPHKKNKIDEIDW